MAEIMLISNTGGERKWKVKLGDGRESDTRDGDELDTGI